MKIVVLGGSPKGANSVTLQYVKYWEACFPEHEYEYIYAAQRVALYEKNPGAFEEVMKTIDRADLVVWAFPLYYLVVHSSYIRFIELIFERQREDVFRGKYTGAVSTSIHFYDHTAQNYIRSICDDLGMKYIGGVPAHMRDLTKKEMQPGLRLVFQRWLETAEHQRGTIRAFAPVRETGFDGYQPVSDHPGPLSAEKKVTIVADLPPGDSPVRRMVERFRKSFPGSELISLREIRMGPCAGCLKCGFDNHCTYEGKDDLIELHREKVLTADVLVFAGAIQRRYLSSTWHRYLERNFNRTHQPVLAGKHIGFLVSGPLSQNGNTREILQAYAETMGGTLADIISDEADDAGAVDSAIDDLAGILKRYAEEEVKLPVSFLGTAGMKLFRDEIYAGLRFVFQSDHRYYKKHGLYDFPQKRIGMLMLMNLAVPLSKIPFLRRKIRGKLVKGMTRPYHKVLTEARPAERRSLFQQNQQAGSETA